MLTPTEAVAQVKSDHEREVARQASVLAENALSTFTQFGNGYHTYADYFSWEAIRVAAEQLNEAGWAVEYGNSHTGSQLDPLRKAIRISTRDYLVEDRVASVEVNEQAITFFACIGFLGFGLLAWSALNYAFKTPGHDCRITIAIWTSGALLCLIAAIANMRHARTRPLRLAAAKKKLEEQKWTPMDGCSFIGRYGVRYETRY